MNCPKCGASVRQVDEPSVIEFNCGTEDWIEHLSIGSECYLRQLAQLEAKSNEKIERWRTIGRDIIDQADWYKTYTYAQHAALIKRIEKELNQ